MGGAGWLDGEVGDILAIEKFYDINQFIQLTKNNFTEELKRNFITCI